MEIFNVKKECLESNTLVLTSQYSKPVYSIHKRNSSDIFATINAQQTATWKEYQKNISKSGRFCPIRTHYGLAHYGLVCILNCWALRLYTNLAVQIVDGFLLVFYAVVCRVLRRFYVSYLFSFQVWSLTQVFFLLAFFVKNYIVSGTSEDTPGHPQFWALSIEALELQCSG